MSTQEQIQDDANTPALITCPGCLHTQPEDHDFCEACGAPLSAFSTIGPFERIFAEGHMYRRAVSGPTRRLVVVGMWALLAPTMLMLIALGLAGEDLSYRNALPIWLGVAVYAILLSKVTINYFSKRKSGAHSIDEDYPS